MKNKRKIIVFMIMLGLIGIFMVVELDAYQKLCLSYGETIPSVENPIYICFHTMCQVCVTDNLFPARPSHCNGIAGCSSLGNDSGIDQEAPELIVNSPIDEEVYNLRRVLFDITINEPSILYYIDNINGKGRWRRLSGKTQRYSKKLSLKDGLNNITIKAMDRNGNVVEIIKQFYVDSKKPKIRKTEPRREFASGEFNVEFQEENPSELVLHYGNSLVGIRDVKLDIEECSIKRRRYSCDVEVELGDYDGEKIQYWFELEDIAGSVAESKPIWLSVDETAPVLLNPDSFWSQGSGRYTKYIYFNMEINEDNFDEVNYIDWNDRRPRWRRLCSRLKDGVCEKKKSFRKGHHAVDIEVIDEAGNAVGERIEFVV